MSEKKIEDEELRAIYKQLNESVETMKKKLSKMNIIRNIDEARSMFHCLHQTAGR